MSTVVRERTFPPTVLALGTMSKPDYADMFTATAERPIDVSPEEWLRSVLHESGGSVRAVLLLASWVQRRILGLRLDGVRRSPDHLIGWRITGRGEGWLRLEASSSLMSGQLVLRREGRRLSLATFVHYERRLAALVWPPVSVVHRRVARMLLRQAAASSIGTARREAAARR